MLKLEPWLHSLPVMWGLGTAIAGLPLTIFNSANLWCWIAPYKDRGAYSDLFRWVFFYGPLWTMIFIVTLNVLLIFHHVRTLEKATERYQGFGEIQYTGDVGIGDSVQARTSDDRIPQEVSDDGCSVISEKEENEGEDSKHDTESERGVVEAGLRESAQNASSTPSSRRNADPMRSSLPPNFKLADTNAARQEKSRFPPPNRMEQRRRIGRSSSSSLRSSLMLGIKRSFHTNDNDRSHRMSVKRKRRSREVANQCLRFAGSFYFTWIALTLTRLLQAINGQTYFPLLVVAATTTPLQGLPNFLVYLYPRYRKAKEIAPEAGPWAWIKGSIAPENGREGRSRFSLHVINTASSRQ